MSQPDSLVKVDYAERQIQNERRYQQDYQSPEVREWLDSLSEEDRKIAVEAGVHIAAKACGLSGKINRGEEIQEHAQVRVDSLSPRIEDNDSLEEKFSSDLEEELEEFRNLPERSGPAILAAAFRVFEKYAHVNSDTEIREAEARGFLKAGDVIMGSKSRRLQLKWSCLAVATKRSELTLSQVAEMHTPVGAAKSQTKQNASKVAKRIAGRLKAPPKGGTLRDKEYSKLRRDSALTAHAKKADAATKPKTKPCPTSSLFSQALTSPLQQAA